MHIAKSIPSVGSIFSPPYNIIGAVDGPVKQLKDGMDAGMAVIDPYVTAISTILGNFDELENIVNATSTSISSFVNAMEGNQCVKQTVSSLVPSFDPSYNSIEQAIVEANRLVSDIASLLEGLEDALADQTWQNVQDGLQTVINEFEAFFSPFEELESIADYLNKDITIEWPTGIKINVRAADCPPGYTNTGVSCFRPNDTIHYPSKVPDCPPGYTNIGLLCHQPLQTYAKWPWESCNSGWTDMGAFCARGGGFLTADHMTCPSGYFLNKIVARCHKICPAGYTNTGDFCERPPDSTDWTSMKCRSNERQAGAFCFIKDGLCSNVVCLQTEKTTFKISELADEFNDLLGSISDIPIIGDIEKIINDAVSKALKPIMDKLGLPGPNDVPSFPTINTNMLPLNALKEAIQNFEPTSFVDQFNFDLVEQQIGKVASTLGVNDLASLLDCANNIECLRDQLGLSSVPLPADLVTDFDNWADIADFETAETALNSIIDSTIGCAKTETVNIPITDGMAKLVGLGGDTPACGLDFEVCTELDIDKDILESALQQIGSIFKPLVDVLFEAASQGEHDDERKLQGSVSTFNDFAISFDILPKKLTDKLLDKLQILQKLNKKLTNGFIINKIDDKTLTSYMFELAMDVSYDISLTVGYKSEGEEIDTSNSESYFSRLDFGLGVDIAPKLSRNLHHILLHNQRRFDKIFEGADNHGCMDDTTERKLPDACNKYRECVNWYHSKDKGLTAFIGRAGDGDTFWEGEFAHSIAQTLLNQVEEKIQEFSKLKETEDINLQSYYDLNWLKEKLLAQKELSFNFRDTFGFDYGVDAGMKVELYDLNSRYWNGATFEIEPKWLVADFQGGEVSDILPREVGLKFPKGPNHLFKPNIRGFTVHATVGMSIRLVECNASGCEFIGQ